MAEGAFIELIFDELIFDELTRHLKQVHNR